MMNHAISGSKIICPTRPTITGFGRCAISLKSCGLRVNPKSNISNVSIGRTINIAFMFLFASTLAQRYCFFMTYANKNRKIARFERFFLKEGDRLSRCCAPGRRLRRRSPRGKHAWSFCHRRCPSARGNPPGLARCAAGRWHGCQPLRVQR